MRHRRDCWQVCYLTVLLLAVAELSLARSARAVVPQDNTWDWKDNARYLRLVLDPSLTDPAQGADVASLPGAVPDPVTQPFRIREAVIRAMDAWNGALGGANPKWILSINAPPQGVKSVDILVRMGLTNSVADAANPNHQAPNQNEFSPIPTPTGGTPTPGPTPTSPGGPPGNPIPFDPDNANGRNPPGANVPALAFFRWHAAAGAAGAALNVAVRGQIVFNNVAPWGVDQNFPGAPFFPVDQYYDAIITALHELGHAMRLDHVMGGVPIGVGAMIDGEVMRPGMAPGHHRVNAFFCGNFARCQHPDDHQAALRTAETGIGGKKLQMKDKAGDPTKRKIGFLSKDPAIDTTVGGGIDPVTNGAHVQIYNPTSGESVCFALPNSPPGAWTASGSSTDPVFRYKDTSFANGPCKTAKVKDGKLLKVKCDAKVVPIGYSLDEATQGSVAVRFISGDTSYCAVFGGTISKDSGTDPPITGGKGQFKAKDALAGECPTPPTSCP